MACNPVTKKVSTTWCPSSTMFYLSRERLHHFKILGMTQVPAGNHIASWTPLSCHNKINPNMHIVYFLAPCFLIIKQLMFIYYYVSGNLKVLILFIKSIALVRQHFFSWWDNIVSGSALSGSKSSFSWFAIDVCSSNPTSAGEIQLFDGEVPVC